MLSDIHYMVSPQKPTSVDDCANNILALAEDLEFERAAEIRDTIHKLEDDLLLVE